MAARRGAAARLVTAWRHARHGTGPPHVYAVLRVLFGLLGLAFLVGLRDLPAFWDPAGLVPAGRDGWKAGVIAAGFGGAAGRALYAANVVAFSAMIVGWWSRLAVALAFAGTAIQASWNPLPLSAGFQVLRVVLFCLLFAETGRVWSVDAWRARASAGMREGDAGADPVPLWPLHLVRVQVAVIYFSTGLWKLGSELWRDGSAIHYVLNNNGFARFPAGPPADAAWVATLLTYVALSWELAFPALVLSARTRRIALLTGVVLHVGMWLTLELGPFPWVMLASYVGFAEPHALAARVRGRAMAPNVAAPVYHSPPERTEV